LTPFEPAAGFSDHAVRRRVALLTFFFDCCGGSFGFCDVKGGELRKCFAPSAMAAFDGSVVVLYDCVSGTAVGVSRLDVPRHES
jgi:hypothetical protein